MARNTISIAILANAAQARRELKSTTAEVEKAGSAWGKTNLTLAGTYAAAMTVAKKSFDRFAEVASEVKQVQRVLGGTAEEASRLRYAAGRVGITADDLSKGLGLLSKHLVANDAAAKSLGVAFKDAAGNVRPMAQVLPEVMDRFARMPAGAAKSALALQVFGKAGLAMLPFLNKGADGLAELSAKSDEYGLTLSGSALKASTEMVQAQKDLTDAMDGVKISVGQALIPAMKSIAVEAKRLAPFIGRITEAVASPEFLAVASVLVGIRAAIAAVNVVTGIWAGLMTVGATATSLAARAQVALAAAFGGSASTATAATVAEELNSLANEANAITAGTVTSAQAALAAARAAGNVVTDASTAALAANTAAMIASQDATIAASAAMAETGAVIAGVTATIATLGTALIAAGGAWLIFAANDFTKNQIKINDLNDTMKEQDKRLQVLIQRNKEYRDSLAAVGLTADDVAVALAGITGAGDAANAAIAAQAKNAVEDASIKGSNAYRRINNAALKAMDALRKQLDDAIQHVQDLIEKRDNYAGELSDLLKGGSITQIPLVRAIASLDGRTVSVTTGVQGFRNGLAARLKAAQDFVANMNALKTKGVSADILGQIASAGPAEGGKLAAALKGASAAQIKEINGLQSSLAATANQFGQDFAAKIYNPQITAAQATVVKLQQQSVDAVNAWIRSLSDLWAKGGTVLAKQLYDAGVGIADGLVEGIQSQKTAVTKQADDLAEWLMTIKARLQINSPSRVFHSIGKNVGLSLVGGVDSTKAAVQASMTRLSGSLVNGVAPAMPSLSLVGGSKSAGGNTYNLNVNVPVNGDAAETGRQVIKVIEAHERRSGVRRLAS